MSGTLGVITAIKLNVVNIPKRTYLMIVHFDDLRATLESVPLILKHKPSAAELIDSYYNDLTRQSREYGSQLTFIEGDPRAVLVVEFLVRQKRKLTARAQALEADLRRDERAGAILHRSEPEEIAQVWNVA